MNVMINDISEDLDTTVTGVQTAITLFLLIMAIFMIPASKLSDRWGRKRCFTAGLLLYGLGALVSALSPGLGVLILGNSVLEGIGTALLIPPVYILTTMAFTDLTSRARAFGIDQRHGGPRRRGRTADRRSHHDRNQLAGGVRLPGRGRRGHHLPEPPDGRSATAGPDTSLRHRRSDSVGSRHVLRRVRDPAGRQRRRAWRLLLAVGAGFLLWFFLHIRARERAGKEPLLSTGLFKNRMSNLGLVTQNIQWLLLMGTSSSSPSSCRPFAATTRSRRASSSPRRRSASSLRRSPRSVSPRGARRRP